MPAGTVEATVRAVNKMSVAGSTAATRAATAGVQLDLTQSISVTVSSAASIVQTAPKQDASTAASSALPLTKQNTAEGVFAAEASTAERSILFSWN